MVQINEMAIKTGNKIVREIILERKLMTKYRLKEEMGVKAIQVVDAWLRGDYFNEARLSRLIEVRDKWLRMKQQGIYSV